MVDVDGSTTLVHGARASVIMSTPHTLLRHIPPPGFSSIAIPLPARSLYLTPMSLDSTTTPAPDALPTSRDRSDTRRKEPPRRLKPEPNCAYTLLIVDDNEIQRKILGRICEKFGQPYELAENGEQAVDMYKANSEKFRGILMDTLMPVMDGFEATKQIRAFEEESWNSCSSLLSTSPSSQRAMSSRNPVRRAVIIAMVPWHYIEGLGERIVNAGFDISLSQPLRVSRLSNLLFSGPCSNVISLYGGVDQAKLIEAGYPLRPRPLKPSRIEDNDATGRTTA